MEFLDFQQITKPTDIKTIATQGNNGRITREGIEAINLSFQTSFPELEKPFDKKSELYDEWRCLHFNRSQ